MRLATASLLALLALVAGWHLPSVGGLLVVVACAPWIAASRRGGVWRAIGAAGGVGILLGLATSTWMPAALIHVGAGPAESGAGWLFIAAFVVGSRFAAIGAALGLLGRLPDRLFVPCSALGVWAIETLMTRPPSIPWALLGHTQVESPLRLFAALGGVPLVSAIVCMLASALSTLRRGELRVGVTTLLAVAGATAALSAGSQWLAFRSAGDGITQVTFLLVQPNIPAGERWAAETQRTSLAQALEVTNKGLAATPLEVDLVLWPETLITGFVEASPALDRALREGVTSLEVPLLLGVVRPPVRRDSGYRNSALWLEPTGLVDSLDKTVLAPFGEAPFWPVTEAPATGWVEPGVSEKPVRGRFDLSVSLCLEVLYPEVVAARTLPSTVAIVNLANDGWFSAPVLSRDQLRLARFRAIEQRRWLLRVADGGVSATVNPEGEVIAALAPESGGWLVARVPEPTQSLDSDRKLLSALAVAGTLASVAITRTTRRWIR